MEIFILGYILGCSSIIAAWIFFNARGKGNSPGTLKERVDRNNTSTREGIEQLKTNNRESGHIIDEAQEEVRRGLKALGNTDRAISEIIEAARRDKTKSD